MNHEQTERAIATAIANHKGAEMRRILMTNAWKVRGGDWTFREWKRHARDLAYHQGPFRAQ